MASLQNAQIDQSYQGLIKTTDNAVIGATEKVITDGEGNASTLSLGTTSASFTGDLDLTNATVTGLPGAGAGLVAGTGADSMVSAASLTTTPAIASGTDSIALGDDAQATQLNSIAIGPNSGATAQRAVALGWSTTASVTDAIAIGPRATATADAAIAIGGDFSNLSATTASATNAIAIGNNAKATAIGAVGLGAGVTAAIIDTVSVKALEVQTDSTPTAGGIIMSDAGGTDRRINIDATGALQIDSTPVGGGGSGGTEFSSAYRNDIYSATMGGYPSNTFAKHMQPIVGRPSMNGSIDQSNNSTLFVRCYGDVGSIMSTIVVPLYAGSTTDVVVEWYSADSTTGMPGTRVYTETFAEATGADGFYEFNLTTPQVMNGIGDWWVGCRTSNDRKLAQISGDAAIHSMASWGGYGGAIGGFTPINTLYYNTAPAPATIPTSYAWSGRDELTMYFWK
jgi:hypothetical protein